MIGLRRRHGIPVAVYHLQLQRFQMFINYRDTES
jgi:hypothetical protein